MNADDLKSALASLLSQTVEAAKAGAEFMKEQIPDVVNQLLMWKMIESLLYFLVGIVVLIAAIIIQVRIFKWMRKEQFDEGWIVWIVGQIFVMVPLGMFITSSTILNLAWIQIWATPKVYLLEYGLKMLK